MKGMLLPLLILALILISVGIWLFLGFPWERTETVPKKTVVTNTAVSNQNTNAPTVNAENPAATEPLNDYCVSNEDCTTGGCSGELCANTYEEFPAFSACVEQDYYECLSLSSCECINNKCQWDQNTDYLSCLKKYQ